MNQKSTFFDNILINHHEYKCNTITSFISDHLPQYIIFENFKENNITRNDSRIEFRDFKDLTMDTIERDIILIGLSLATENIDADLSFVTFLRLFCRAFDVQAPLKKITKKKTKEKTKPWVTKNI